MPPPQGIISCLRCQCFVLVVFLVVLVPLRSPSADEPPPPGTTDCPEARRWPIFCSALLNTTLLNDTARRKVKDSLPRAKDYFCEMVKVLNKIDCAQPFTVSPRWRLGCQEAYRDWSCSLLADGLLPVGLNSCDSTCHQVIRVCPYLSPDRVQEVEVPGKPKPKAVLHPSQYGGHPAFHCPTTYTDPNHLHTEDYFFPPHYQTAHVCILFNPSEAGLSHASFPLHTLDLHNFSVTYCQEYSKSILDNNYPLLADRKGKVNVSQCCWTYNTALPKTYNLLSSTLRRSVLEDKNCVPLAKDLSPTDLHEENPSSPPPNQEILKQVFLQCLVTQDTPSPNNIIEPLSQESIDYAIYVDDSGFPSEEESSRNRREKDEDEDPSIDRFNSAEGEDNDYEDEEYDFSRGSATTTEAFLSLISSLESQTTPSNHQSSTSSIGRDRRSLASYTTMLSIPNANPRPHPFHSILLILCLAITLLLPSSLFCILNYKESANYNRKNPSTNSQNIKRRIHPSPNPPPPIRYHHNSLEPIT